MSGDDLKECWTLSKQRNELKEKYKTKNGHRMWVRDILENFPIMKAQAMNYDMFMEMQEKKIGILKKMRTKASAEERKEIEKELDLMKYDTYDLELLKFKVKAVEHAFSSLPRYLKIFAIEVWANKKPRDQIAKEQEVALSVVERRRRQAEEDIWQSIKMYYPGYKYYLDLEGAYSPPDHTGLY